VLREMKNLKLEIDAKAPAKFAGADRKLTLSELKISLKFLAFLTANLH